MESLWSTFFNKPKSLQIKVIRFPVYIFIDVADVKLKNGFEGLCDNMARLIAKYLLQCSFLKGMNEVAIPQMKSIQGLFWSILFTKPITIDVRIENFSGTLSGA